MAKQLTEMDTLKLPLLCSHAILQHQVLTEHKFVTGFPKSSTAAPVHHPATHGQLLCQQLQPLPLLLPRV
jgi:hypothetical protein